MPIPLSADYDAARLRAAARSSKDANQTWRRLTHPGKAVAWAMTADHNGNTRSPGLLVADTPEELRAMLPASSQATTEAAHP